MRLRFVSGVAAAAIAMVLSSCASALRPAGNESDLADAVTALSRDLPGDLAALYDMRVSKSGGLRLAVVTSHGAGRMTISEPFGAAVSIAAWTADGSSVHLDMDRGCRQDAADLEAVLGLDALPLAQAVRLLGGRLPTGPGDEVGISEGGVLEMRGAGWSATATVAADPWRVVEVRQRRDGGWRIELDDHTASVPGRIMVTNSDGRWAELELRRMEWPEGLDLPDLPALPPCARR